MRLRRIELVIIGVTLAFACFIGGYFTGRTTSAVSITPTVTVKNGLPADQAEAAPAALSPANNSGAAQSQQTAQSQQAAQAAQTAQSPIDTAGDTNLDASGQPAPDAGGEHAPVGSQTGDGRININLASRSELMDLPGIGGTLASRIVDYRDSNGPFSVIEDLRKVSGIGEKRFEAIKDKITV